MTEQLHKQVARLRELRVKKVEEPGMPTRGKSYRVIHWLLHYTRCVLRG